LTLLGLGAGALARQKLAARAASRVGAPSRLSFRACALGFVVAGLAACATPVQSPTDAPIRSGRLAVRVDATPLRPSQNFSAAFELQGRSERGLLRLLSPIGTEVARVRWQPGQAALTVSGLERPYASLDDLADEVLGERVPLAALTDWIEGRPWPGAAHTATALGFSQMAWEVDLSGRAERRITARRSSPPTVVLRVVLDETR
jgi:outer membrane lipoprotein LolB